MALPGLPAVSDAALPRTVRDGTPADRDAYRAALGFERLLLGQLVEQMTAATPSLAEGPRGDAVTDAMTDALAGAGGVGLAPQLFQTLRRPAP